jgi:hypothetical protein
MHVDSVHSMPLGICKLQQAPRPHRIVQDADFSGRIRAAHETPHERGYGIRRKKLAKVQAPRGVKLPLVRDRRGL